MYPVRAPQSGPPTIPGRLSETGPAMPLSVRCSCGKSLNVPDHLAGKRGKCPACGAAVEVRAAAPANKPAKPAPEDARPGRATEKRRKKKRADRSGGPPWLLIGGGGAGLLLVVGLVVFLAS